MDFTHSLTWPAFAGMTSRQDAKLPWPERPGGKFEDADDEERTAYLRVIPAKAGIHVFDFMGSTTDFTHSL